MIGIEKEDKVVRKKFMRHFFWKEKLQEQIKIKLAYILNRKVHYSKFFCLFSSNKEL